MSHQRLVFPLYLCPMNTTHRLPLLSLRHRIHPTTNRNMTSFLSTSRRTALAFALGILSLLSFPAANAQTLYVGNGSIGQTTTFTSGTNSYFMTYVGNLAGDSNNLLTIANSGTLLATSVYLYVGYNGSSNSLVISDGGHVVDGEGDLGYSASFPTPSASNNSALVTGTGSLWSNSSLSSLRSSACLNTASASSSRLTAV